MRLDCAVDRGPEYPFIRTVTLGRQRTRDDVSGCRHPHAIMRLRADTLAATRRQASALWRLMALAFALVASGADAQTRLPAQKVAQAADAALTPFAREKARTLLSAQLSCLGCHRLGGEGGLLAPALDDVRTRRDAIYIARIIDDPASVRPGAAMPRIRMPASQRALIIRYLGGTPMTPSIRSLEAGTGEDANVAVIYQKWCAGCHGATGKGDGPNAKQLPVAPSQHANASHMQLRTDDALFDTIFGGGALMNRSARMPAFGESLNTVQIRALVQYIRKLCACRGPRWSHDGAE